VPLFGFSRLPLKLFAKKIFRRIIDNAVSDRAALIAYYFLFAIFPFLFFMVTLAAYLPFVSPSTDLVARMAPFVPADALGLVKGHLDDLLHNQHPHLLTLGFAVALWSASRGVDSLRGALNLSYDVKESRPFWKTNGIALGITILTSVLMLLSFAGFALGTDLGVWLADKLGMQHFWAFAWAWVRWPVVAAMIMTVEALLYYYLPDVDQEFRFITPGSIIGTVLWLLSTWGFTQYVQHFGNYNATYGSIGGVIVLMTWLWISGLIFVLGGEMNALLEHESPEGKAKGARAAGETPPPVAERPSASAPGVVDSADAAERSDERLQERPPTEQLH
jgi:membrane protein